MGTETMSRNQITEEAQKLRGQLQEIKDRKRDGLYPVEDAMEKASITVRLAELWTLWRDADWDYTP